MADIYIPGVNSRFDTDTIIENLMKVERQPKERAEATVEQLKAEKTYWQDVGRRMTSLRESARSLYSFQNPFNDRVVSSSAADAITGTATREAVEQELRFAVKQIAQADRFLSRPLEEKYTVEGGEYTFTAGQETVTFTFKGGSLTEFVDTLNRRGKNKVQASLVAVRQGSKALLIESKITGEDNRLGFAGAAVTLGEAIGLIARQPVTLNVGEGAVETGVGAQSSLDVTGDNAGGVTVSPGMTLTFDAAFADSPEAAAADAAAATPPPGPSIPSAGSISFGGVVVENSASSVSLPVWTPPVVERRDDPEVVYLRFSDGSSQPLAVEGGAGYASREYNLGELAAGKTLVSIDVVNNNTHRNVALRNVQILDPDGGDFQPVNPITTAQDAVLTMEGIEIYRPTNSVDDLVPGVTLTLKAPTERTATVKVEPDREAVKESLITLVGNYNRLMAEINVLTRTDSQIIEELTYLTDDERTSYEDRLGHFQSDTTLNQMRSALQRAMAAPYPTSLDQDLTLLSQIGIGTNVTGTSGYDASRLRGYLEIDEKTLDAALADKMPAIKELFGSDTDGDLIVDTGVAYAMESMTKPYVETAGIIALKTSTLDSRLTQQQQRIETLDKQLASKEQALRTQYAEMESAYSEMERLSTSLDQFSTNNSTSK